MATVCSGWLQKRGHLRKNWTARYFVLEVGPNGPELLYYKKQGETQAKGAIPLRNGTFKMGSPEPGSSAEANSPWLYFDVEASTKTNYPLRCKIASERMFWADYLSAAMKGESPPNTAPSSAQTSDVKTDESPGGLEEAQRNDEELPSAKMAQRMHAFCQDWKTYEELSLSIFKIQEGLVSKQDLVTHLRRRFVPFAEVLADFDVEDYTLRPQQRCLAASRQQGDVIQMRLKEALSQGILPHPDNRFGQFSCNALFLSVRQQTTKEQLATEDGILQFQLEFNLMSADKWGSLVAQHPAEFVDIELSEDQVAAAEHFRAHRKIQHDALQEIQASMIKIDPFWKYRSFAFGHAFLHAKLLCHFSVDQFQVWMDGQAAQDPELYSLLQLHKSRFVGDALSPSEQAQIWPRMIDFSQRGDMSQLGAQVGQGAALELSSTPTAYESDGGQANAQAVSKAKASLHNFTGKLVAGVLQESLGEFFKVSIDVFCASLESNNSGFSSWCLENKFLLLTRPLNEGGDQQRLTSAVQFLHMNNFAEAKKELVEWQNSHRLMDSEPQEVFSPWRKNVSFILAKVSMETMLAQQCQQMASQLSAIDNAVVSELAAVDPVASFLELAALAACGAHDPATAKKGRDHVLKQAQTQMAAAGQPASKAQVEQMIAQSKAQQLETYREALVQQAGKIESLARAYKAGAGAAAPEQPTASLAANGVSLAMAAESQQSVSPQIGPNAFDQYSNNGNFLVAVLMAHVMLEAITEPIHAYLNRTDPGAAQFLAENRLHLACISPASEAVAALKQLANERPSSDTPALVLKISQCLEDLSVSAEKEFACIDESLAAALGRHMRDPGFALLHDSLAQVGAQMHAQAYSMLSQGASQDPSGTLEQIASLLNSAKGKHDFIAFPLSGEARTAAQGILEQQGAFAQVLAQAEVSKKGARDYVESVTKDIAPFYSTLATSGGKVDGLKAAMPADVFEPVRAGAFFAANVADEAILGVYCQFMVFRRTARADPTTLPKVISACNANAPFKAIGKLISNNTEAFVSGHWLPEEMNFAYVKATETKMITWHEEEVAASGPSPFRSWATDITFLLAKKAIFDKPSPETFAEMQQQLIGWGRADIAQGIGQYANELLQTNGGKLSPVELARIDSMDEAKDATSALRRRVMGLSGRFDADSRAFDDIRMFASGAGSGVSGIETLMVLASVVNGGSNSSPQASALQARLARRDPVSAELVVRLGQSIFERGEQLLRNEENRLKYGATAGLLRACLPPAEQGQFGTLVTASTDSLPTTTCVIPPLDVGMFSPAVRKLCRAHVKHLQAALMFCVARDQSLKDIPKSRKKSVFEAHYLGGHTGSSTQFLLWKLEFIGLETADDCQQVINGEQKAVGQLIFANTAAFRAEPFLSEELNSLKELLRKAEVALGSEVEDADHVHAGGNNGTSSGALHAKGAAGAKAQSVFAECWNDPSFCHEVIVAQQLCDQEDYSDSEDPPKTKVMKRFRVKPELAKYRMLVETHFEAFVREPLPVAAQMIGWQQYLQLKFQADYAAASNDDKPELAQAIASKDVQRVLRILDDHRHLSRDVLFAPYGQVSNQSLLLDALRVGPFEVVEMLIQHGYPVSTQRVGNSDSGASWPLLHYLLIAWAEHVRNASHDISAMQQRFSDVLPLLAEKSADFRAEANGFTPLYIAATSSVDLAVQGILSVIEQRGVPSSHEINRAVGDESAPTSVFQAVANGSDPSMLQLLHARGGDLEAPRVALNAQMDIVQSTPPLHLALLQVSQTHDLTMVEALLGLGASPNSCSMGPWLQSELIKQLGRTHTVGNDLTEEMALTLMRTSCLMAAATLGAPIMELLLAKGASPTFADPTSGFTTLHQVVYCADLANSSNHDEANAIRMAELLLKAGADIHARTSFGNTPLYLATQKRLKNMTKFLMSQGADPSVGNNDAETPLHMAVFIGDPEIFALFFSNLGPEASTSLRDTRGNTPLHYAASFNQLDILAILVQAGGDLQAKNKEGCTVFLQSVTAGRKEVAASLMQLNPSSVQDTDAQGGNALHMTCKSGSIEMMAPMVMWLLSVGVNVHARDTHNCLPLHYAASSGSVTCTRILLWKMLETLAYAQPSASDTLQNTNQGDSVNNSTPPVSNVGAGVMSFASVCGLSPDVDIASLAGGQKEVARLLGTPLFFAAHHRRTEVVDLLLNGVPRPCHVAPLHELAVPQAGWICDASGTDVPFPGQYMMASDGSDFCLRLDVWEAATAAAQAATSGPNGDAQDLAWRQRAGVLLRYLEPVELTELLCFAVDTINEPLVHLLLQSGASANSPDFLAKKTPLQYATNDADSQAADDANAHLGASALVSGSNLDNNNNNNDRSGGVGPFTENPMMVQGAQQGTSSGGLSSSSSSSSFTSQQPTAASSEAHARARIRKALVAAGAQVFIASDSTQSKKALRTSVCGNSALHRRVWLKKECALLSPEQQAEVESNDDDLGRSPLHHAASRGQVAWMRVLREYGADFQGKDVENWQPLHAAAYGGEPATTALLLQWRAAKILNATQEWARRQGEGSGGDAAKNAAAVASIGAGAAWSLEQETVHGETAAELCARGRNEIAAQDPNLLFCARLQSWSLQGVALGALTGALFGHWYYGDVWSSGSILNSVLSVEATPSTTATIGMAAGIGALIGLIGSGCLALSLWFTHACRTGFQNCVSHKARAESQQRSADAVKRNAQLQRYRDTQRALRAAGAHGPWSATRLRVHAMRKLKFAGLAAYCALCLPFMQLRDLLQRRSLAEAFLTLRLPGAACCATTTAAGASGGGDVSSLDSSKGRGRSSTGASIIDCGASVIAAVVVLALIGNPLVLMAVPSLSVATAQRLAAGHVGLLCLWVLLLLRHALSEARLWRTPKKPPRDGSNISSSSSSGGGSGATATAGTKARATAANATVAAALFLEWQQLAGAGFVPTLTWPTQLLPLSDWYAFFQFDMSQLGFQSGGTLTLPDDDAYLSSLSASMPNAATSTSTADTASGTATSDAITVTAEGAAMAQEFYQSTTSLLDLRNADTVTFWLNSGYAFLWAGLAGVLAAASMVRADPRLRRRFPFVRSDFYGQIPGARTLVPFLCSAFFLSILSSLFGTFACALEPTNISSSGAGDGEGENANDDESDGVDQGEALREALLAYLDNEECFTGSHRISVAVALLGLTFYLPSAFLVAISFLSDEQNPKLDVRFVVAFEVIVSACKVALALVVLLFTPRPVIMLAVVALLLLALASTTWRTKPCRDVAGANVMRFGFHCSALLAVGCAALALHFDDASNDLPALVFILGHVALLSAFVILSTSRRDFGAYVSPQEDTTTAMKKKAAGIGSTTASVKSTSSNCTSASMEMENGLLGAGALELVALPSLSAAGDGEVNRSKLRVSAMLDMVLSEEEIGDGDGGEGGNDATRNSGSNGAMAKDAVAAAIQKSKTEAKAKAAEFLEGELMGFMGSLGFA